MKAKKEQDRLERYGDNEIDNDDGEAEAQDVKEPDQEPDQYTDFLSQKLAFHSRCFRCARCDDVIPVKYKAIRAEEYGRRAGNTSLFRCNTCVYPRCHECGYKTTAEGERYYMVELPEMSVSYK